MSRRELESIPLSRFGVLVAQLESIAASARQQPPDALLCFDLLSDLTDAIEEEPKESIAIWQRKCEDALHSLLTLGARRPVRRLASAAMVRVISKGDGISIYSRASTLQGWLADCKRSEPLAVAGVALCLGELYRIFGRRITSGLLETINIVAKLMKFHEDFVRQDALQMLEKALEGSAASGAPTAYSEAFRIIMRVGVNDKSFVIRLSAARCLKTFASIGGPGLGTVELESSISFCIKALEDPSSSVRDAFAEALGALLALVMHPEAQVRQRGKNHPVPVKRLDDALQKYLKAPFIRASGFHAKDFRIGMALSWVSFLQVIRVKYHMPEPELQNFALQALDMLQKNPVVNAHALACVLYILRVGVIDLMTEPTQRSFLVLLGKKLESSDYSPFVGVATLRILSYMLTTLGEVPVEFKDILDNTVVAALSHSSSHVRVEAALTLRALAEVDPTCVGGLISYGVTTLQALRETVFTEKGNHTNLELDSLHGQSSVLAALVSISPKLLLGYPARLPKSVFEVSRKMLTEFSRSTVAATVEKEAGWLLLASLIASMPKEELEDQVFDVLLLWASPFVGNPDFLNRQTHDLSAEMRVLSAAIEALTAFIRSFVSPISSANAGVLLQPVLAYLSGALSYISYLTTKESQSLKPALELFIIRTLMCYQSISDPLAFKSEHAQIVQICTTPFSDPARCEESSCLRFLLDKRDACLGPWIPGRDWFEDELRAFDGGNDGLMPCLWDDEVCSFPQLEPINKMLVNQKLLCFANIFATQDNGGKLEFLNKIDQCLKSGKKQPWRVSSITNSCVGLLAGLKAVLALRPQPLEFEILSVLQAIFQSILAEGESAQRRAASEGLGLLARLGSDIFTARLTRSLLGELAVATDPSYLGSVAFTLGCIHRSAGGMALSTLVPATVSSISLLAKSSNASLQLWSLHALLLTIEAAGLSYVSQVQATLSLAIEILLLEENGLVDTRQEIGHLINAIVAVLGPELSPGSIFFCRCKAVIAEVCSCQETSTLLESVRFTQQLVLFAPQAVSVHSHVQSLLPTLSSKQPSLRYLAVSTLRHLIEKDPVAMIHEKIEENLFSMLDEETDSEIGGLVRATIMRLLYTSCSSCPSRWLAILRKLVLATSTRSNVINKLERSENEHINGKSEGEARLYYGEDDEDMVASTRSDPLRDKHLRYRTKVFAAECLSNLPAAVGTDPAHFDLSLARSQSANGHTPDWLVLHLQDLISLAYQISTGQFEGLQSIGVILLGIVMDKFEKIPDPEVPGHLLLEQYQAQFVSAVRSAISVSAGPLLLEAGLQLATKILRSSIISGDRVALSRMFSLISRPLNDIKDLYYPSFAEWVACKIKVRLLAAHASIKCYVYQIMREQKVIPDEYQQLIPLFSSSSPILGKYWISVLKDYTYVCFGLHSNFKYIAFLDGIQSLLVSSKVKKCLDESWPLIFRATALDAVPVIPETDSSSDKNAEDLPKTSLESGYCMIRLEPWEFQFLWGLGLIVLFQGQQVNSGKQLQPLFTHRKKKNSADSILQGMHIMMSGEIALPVFMCLSKEMFYGPKYLTLDLCRELLQVLLRAEHSADSWNQIVTCLLLQIVQFCPIEFFEKEDFVDTATELCFKQLFIAFQSIDAASQECPSFIDMLSGLSVVAETIASRLNHKMNRLKFILASMSVCHELFTIASTTTVLSKIITFLQNVLPCLNKCFRDETNHAIDYHTQLEMVMGTWASMLAFFSQDCTRRIHSIDNKTSTVYKLLAKMLAFCLEEAASLARLFHEKHHLGQDKDNILLFTIFKNFTKCIRDTFYDSSIQVQIIGLHVLKNIAQKDLAEAKDHSFSLLFAGELFGDIFLLIQHTLKERLSKEAVVVTEECLRLLFLFHTLSQASESVSAVTVLLLEALHTVFSLSSVNDSQELSQVNTSTRRLVSHLVQIPSSASQIKEAILSMPLSRRQRFQDMIRASVTQGQMVTEMKSKGESDRDDRKDEPNNVSVQSDRPEMEDNGDDDEDWDAFQSVGVNDLSDSAADITIDHEREKYSHLEVETDEPNPEEMANTEQPSVPEYSEGDVNDQQVSDSVLPDSDSKELLEDHGERLMGCESNVSDNEEATNEQRQVVDDGVVESEGVGDGSNQDSDDTSTAPKVTTDEGESGPADGEGGHLKHYESTALDSDDISTAPKVIRDEGESGPADGEDDRLKHSKSAASDSDDISTAPKDTRDEGESGSADGEDDTNDDDQQHLNQEHGE